MRVNLLAVVGVLALAATASAQEPKRFDWKPAAANAVGASLDALSTYRFSINGSGCHEATPVFRLPSGDPNMKRIWLFAATGTVGVALINHQTGAWRARAPHSSAARWADRIAKSAGYGMAARRVGAAVDNIRDCGW